jgi:integrase
MARRPDIGNVQLYPDRPLRRVDKNGYVLKFFCPILGKRIRRNCGTRDRREARRIQRECRDRLLNGEYKKSGGAITAADAKVSRPTVTANGNEKSWQEAVESYRTKFKGRSVDHVVSRLGLAERVLENRHKARGLPPGLILSECLTDEGIEYLQERLLIGEECRYKVRASTTVNSIVRNVMTFARYCRRKKWIAQIPEVERVMADEAEDAMKGRPITTEEFERMLVAVPKVVGEGPAESWRFTLQVLWESAFRVGDVMDFSWDDPRHIYPKWPHRPGLHPTLVIPKTQKNGKEQQIPMLPGLAELLQRIREDERTGWVVNPMPVEYEMESQRTGWFMPARADMEHLVEAYSNSAIARACGVSETTVRKWLAKLGIPSRGKSKARAAKVPPDKVAVLEARAARRLTHHVRRGSGRLTTERVSRVICKIGKEANVVVQKADEQKGKRIKYASAHDLRRGCAARLINLGGSAESLQVIMRHEDFATTQKFYSGTKAAQAAAAEVYEKLAAGCKTAELGAGLVGGLPLPLSLTPEQQKKLKALLESL